MTLQEYQEAAVVTAKYPNYLKVIYPTLGLCGEAGEVAEKVKKIYRDKEGDIDETSRELLKRKLGDVLWYISVVASDLNLSLEDIGQTNIAKLKDRKNRGVISGSGDTR